MNVRFLKEISEAYVIDFDLKQTPDQIFEDLYDLTKFLQTFDESLYNELYELTRLKQQQILKGYLDLTYRPEQVQINEVFDFGLASGGAILSFIIVSIFRKPISNAIAKSLSTAGEVFETLGRWLARHGKYQQIRYAIIQENTKKCYVKCGIQKPSDIHILSYLTLRSSSTVGGKESIEQGMCLRECYIEELIDVIGLHMENYFACLKRTGGFSAVQRTDTDDIMKMVSSTNVAAACESYYTAAREALDNFYRVLELVYDRRSEEDKRLEKINKLRSKIYESRQTIQKTDEKEIQKYGDGKFPAPQPRVPYNNPPPFRKY